MGAAGKKNNREIEMHENLFTRIVLTFITVDSENNHDYTLSDLECVCIEKPLSYCQEEECKVKTEKKVIEVKNDVREPGLQGDDPVTVLTAIISQV